MLVQYPFCTKNFVYEETVVLKLYISMVNANYFLIKYEMEKNEGRKDAVTRIFLFHRRKYSC